LSRQKPSKTNQRNSSLSSSTLKNSQPQLTHLNTPKLTLNPHKLNTPVPKAKPPNPKQLISNKLSTKTKSIKNILNFIKYSPAKIFSFNKALKLQSKRPKLTNTTKKQRKNKRKKATLNFPKTSSRLRKTSIKKRMKQNLKREKPNLKPKEKLKIHKKNKNKNNNQNQTQLLKKTNSSFST
jgi:hypothetical protein